MTDVTAETAATVWLADFAAALAAEDITATVALFNADCYWRDLLSFTWNIKTFAGRDDIAKMLHATLAATAPSNWQILEQSRTDDGVIEAWFTFDTAVARGWGLMRLRDGRCWTLLTTMTALKGYEEKTGVDRIQGVNHGAERDRQTWQDLRQLERRQLGEDVQPYCVIIGGGQGGIALGARLRRLGVPTLILEKNARAGDSWRNRYRSLVLHDPVWYDHLPYLPFPDDWPVFCPKDKFGDWLEMYAKVMELNYWTESECRKARYNEASACWEIQVRRGDTDVTLRPRQLVFATGAYGYPKQVEFPGAGQFSGTTLHSSAYQNGAAFRGKKCLVIGSGSSAHDICADLWENHVDVTMIQRSPTIVIRSESLMTHGFADLYSEQAVARGVTTDKADMIFASQPFALMAPAQRPVYETIAHADADFYQRLEKAGFLLTFGPDKSGLMMQALRTASNYYIDVGASDLIASGEIKLKAGVEIQKITETGIAFADGSALPADVIIHATGYGSMDEMVAHLISEDMAEKVGPFWGYGSGIKGDPGPWQGELRNMWKPTAQEALWFHGGNLHLSRHYSLYVALQIKARMEGIPTPVY